MNTSILEQHWHSYIAAFNSRAKSERERLLALSVSDEVVFTNPGGEGKSRGALSAHIGKFQSGNQGAYFTTDKLYAQADKLLAIWSMHKPDGAKVASGYNFVQAGLDGRFAYMAGFF
jgi:hypothetical protein